MTSARDANTVLWMTFMLQLEADSKLSVTVSLKLSLFVSGLVYLL